MTTRARWAWWIGAVGLVALALAACGAWPGRGPNREASVENGRQIYYTGTNARGEPIPYQGGPAWGGMGMMGGGSLACVACHGPDGRGGPHMMMGMQVMDAPDIRYQTLASEAHDEGAAGEHDEAPDDPDAAYGLDDFRRAVVEGRHPDGEPLSPDMLRWQLSDRDLADLLAFLKTLP